MPVSVQHIHLSLFPQSIYRYWNVLKSNKSSILRGCSKISLAFHGRKWNISVPNCLGTLYNHNTPTLTYALISHFASLIRLWLLWEIRSMIWNKGVYHYFMHHYVHPDLLKICPGYPVLNLFWRLWVLLLSFFSSFFSHSIQVCLLYCNSNSVLSGGLHWMPFFFFLHTKLLLKFLNKASSNYKVKHCL